MAQTALWVTLILQFVTYYLDTVAQIIYVEQYFGELIPQSPICQWQWLLVTWLISIPVMQIPTLHESRYISCIAMFWVCANVLCIAYEVWLVQPWSCDPGPSFPPTNPLRLLMAASSMAYAFGGHGVYAPLQPPCSMHCHRASLMHPSCIMHCHVHHALSRASCIVTCIPQPAPSDQTDRSA